MLDSQSGVEYDGGEIQRVDMLLAEFFCGESLDMDKLIEITLYIVGLFEARIGVVRCPGLGL
jgi:hypothetical protein